MASEKQVVTMLKYTSKKKQGKLQHTMERHGEGKKESATTLIFFLRLKIAPFVNVEKETFLCKKFLSNNAMQQHTKNKKGPLDRIVYNDVKNIHC